MSCSFNLLGIAVPKCGTYLLASFFKSLGFIDQELHVYNNDVEDYGGLKEEEKILRPVRTFKFDLVTHLKWSLNNTFVVGHPGLTADLKKHLQHSNTRAVYVYRDLRCAAISQMRFLHKAQDIAPWVKEEDFFNINNDRPLKLLSFLNSKSFDKWINYARIMHNPWVHFDHVFHVRYEDLVIGNIALLLQYLEATQQEPRYIGMPSRTYNADCASTLEEWGWSRKHGRLWDSKGAKDINFSYE